MSVLNRPALPSKLSDIPERAKERKEDERKKKVSKAEKEKHDRAKVERLEESDGGREGQGARFVGSRRTINHAVMARSHLYAHQYIRELEPHACACKRYIEKRRFTVDHVF